MRQVVVHWAGGTPGYGDARVGGRYAISRPGVKAGTTDRVEIVTDTGPVPQPLGRPAQYPRLPPTGPRIACGWSDGGADRAKEWTGDAWLDRGLSCGTNPVIYDNDGLLHISHCGSVGVQGWRYVTPANQLITGDASYAPKAGEPPIWEYTAWPDFRIGQGPFNPGPGGVKVWSQATGVKGFSHGALRPIGNLKNVHAHRVDNDFAVTVVDYEQHLTTVTWATMAELLGVPLPPPPNPLCTQCGRLKVDHLRVPLVTGGETAVCPRNVYAGV